MEENMELREMRRQLELLKAQVAKQKLVSDLNMRKMAKSQLAKLKLKFWWKVMLCLFGMVYCPWAFRDIMGVSVGFALATEVFLACALLFEIVTHKDLWSNYFNFNMAEFGTRMLRIKRLNAAWFKWSLILIFPWFAWFVYETYRVSAYEYQWVALAIGGLAGGFFGFCIGFRMYRKEQDALQDLAEQMGELAEERE